MREPNKHKKTVACLWGLAVSLFFLTAIFFVQSSFADIGPTKKTTTVRMKESQEPAEQSSTKKPWFDAKHFQEQLTYEDLKIHPRFRSEYVLDDNVFRERDGHTDSIFREIPGIQVVIPVKEHYFKADYEAQFEKFVHNGHESDVNQYFKSEGALNFTNSFLRVTEDITKTSDRSGTTFTERIPRFENNVDVTGGYLFNQFRLETGYNNFVRKYSTSREQFLEYHHNRLHSRLYMDVTEKTKTFVDYVLTDYTYPNDGTRDATSNEISGGFKGYLLPKTSFFSKFGYEHIGYDSSSDGNHFVAEVGAHYDPLAGTSIDTGWTRSLEQSTYSTNSYLRQDEVFILLKQELTEKIAGESKVAYAKQHYPERATAGNNIFTGKRDDDLFTFDIKLVYRFNSWMNGDVMYQYNRRDSNASVFDYTNNILTIGLSFQA